MKQKTSNRGYTILEVLIFLAVSGFILVAALIAVNGRQEQIQYQQGVRDVDLAIQATINDVSNGYFPRDDFNCEDDGSSILSISAFSGSEQGTRKDCVFAGKALIFNENNVTTSTIAGLRPALGSPGSLSSAKLTPLNGPAVNLDVSIENPWGLRVVKFTDESGADDLEYVAYLSDFGRQAQDGGIDSGTQAISLYKSFQSLNEINQSGSLQRVSGDDAIYVCMESNNGNRKAVIILGKDGRQFTTTIDQDAEGKYEDQCGF